MSTALTALSAGGAPTPSDPQAAQIRKIQQTAQAFESILLRQMLREVRQSSIVAKPASSHSAYLEMADEQMANHMATNGGMGFGKAMAQQMIQQVQAAKLITSPPNAVKP